MGDKEKIPGKKYVGYCKCHGWLTADEVGITTEFRDKDEEDKEKIKKKTQVH